MTLEVGTEIEHPAAGLRFRVLELHGGEVKVVVLHEETGEPTGVTVELPAAMIENWQTGRFGPRGEFS